MKYELNQTVYYKYGHKVLTAKIVAVEQITYMGMNLTTGRMYTAITYKYTLHDDSNFAIRGDYVAENFDQAAAKMQEKDNLCQIDNEWCYLHVKPVIAGTQECEDYQI